MDLVDRWEDDDEAPPVPAERDVNEDIELVDVHSETVVQKNKPGRLVWALENRIVIDLAGSV